MCRQDIRVGLGEPAVAENLERACVPIPDRNYFTIGHVRGVG